MTHPENDRKPHNYFIINNLSSVRIGPATLSCNWYRRPGEPTPPRVRKSAHYGPVPPGVTQTGIGNSGEKRGLAHGLLWAPPPSLSPCTAGCVIICACS